MTLWCDHSTALAQFSIYGKYIYIYIYVSYGPKGCNFNKNLNVYIDTDWKYNIKTGLKERVCKGLNCVQQTEDIIQLLLWTQ